jgi:hypothetical protein
LKHFCVNVPRISDYTTWVRDRLAFQFLVSAAVPLITKLYRLSIFIIFILTILSNSIVFELYYCSNHLKQRTAKLFMSLTTYFSLLFTLSLDRESVHVLKITDLIAKFFLFCHLPFQLSYCLYAHCLYTRIFIIVHYKRC